MTDLTLLADNTNAVAEALEAAYDEGDQGAIIGVLRANAEAFRDMANGSAEALEDAALREFYGNWTPEHLDELYAMSREGLLDVLLMDVGAMGFTAWREVMPSVKAAGAAGSPHAWGEPLKTLYAAQIACGLGNVNIVEGVPGTTHGVDDSAYTLAGGELTLPDTPGFGLELEIQ